MKRSIILMLIIIGFRANSQTKVELEAGLTLASKQYWRGMIFCSTPNIQPEATLSNGHFSLNMWSAVAFNRNYSEIDLTPTWTIGDFDLSLVDYYCPIVGETNNFFDTNDDNNRHSTEFMAVYNANKLPVNITIATFFFGDKNEETNKPFYSTYAEVGYPFTVGPVDVELALGFTPASGYYAEKTAVVHSGITVGKEFDLKHGLTLPLNLSLNANPSTSEFYAVFTLGIFYN